MNYCIVTTINPPTKAIERLYELFGKNLIIVGDLKTPADWNYNGIVPIENLQKPYAPKNHYARKNLGYLEAIKNKADLIYDTDDDNIPNKQWAVRNILVNANGSVGGGWYNVYRILSSGFVWPRGFSLRKIKDIPQWDNASVNRISPIQQGVADGDPDVDAIWRMFLKTGVYFYKQKSVYLNPETWCPFNSQSTWWFPKAYPLMYLPIYATFRMTDIWRSFVAQKCLWALGDGVTFHSPAEVYQDRNEHDLMKDFEDEVFGYLNNDRIVKILGELKLKAGDEFVCDNLLACYRALVNNNILPGTEIPSVLAWIKDYESSKFLL